MKILIITGGSSGIGKATADFFSKKGYKVYELSRHGVSTEGITHIDCDVTSPDDCHAAVQQALATSLPTGDGNTSPHTDSLDGITLISNAGMGISGAVEFTELSEAQRQFDVNFFGSLNITQAVLPYMRQQHSGRIIFISSVAAVFAIPFQAFYSASKAAISSMAMSLRNEVAPFGISVCCLLPGDVKTGFTSARAKSITGSDVYTRLDKAVKTMEHDEENGITPERMAQKLYSMAEAHSVCPFYTVGLQYHLFLFLSKILPASILYKVVGKMY